MSQPVPASPTDGHALRARLANARLMLLFTPQACGGADPEGVLRALLPEVDAVQVRCKPLAAGPSTPDRPGPPAQARASHDWTRRCLEWAAELQSPPLVLVDDRVDVALALAAEGCAGVHLGTHDFPPTEARELLGPELLIGASTHGAAEVARTAELPVDYLGFGPVFATATKGYQVGLGPEQAWVAQAGSTLPLFPIGGIDGHNAHTLATVGRAAVGSALLAADDPVAAARDLRAALCEAGGDPSA